MAKRNKDLVETLRTERYLIYAILVAIVVSAGLLAKISFEKIQMDIEVDTPSYHIQIKHK